jgi:hypothetical protein
MIIMIRYYLLTRVVLHMYTSVIQDTIYHLYNVRPIVDLV